MIGITFLGTVSGIPSKERKHPAIVLEYFSEQKDTLLFDCGEGTQTQLMLSGISFMKIDKIFITHWHADHFAGLIPLLATMNLEGRKEELTIFGPEAEKFMSNILDLGYFGMRFPVSVVNVPFSGEEITKVFETDEYEILSIPVLHSVPSVGYCFKEKDRWNIDTAKLKKLGLKRGQWLKKLKKFGEADVSGEKISIKDLANSKPGLKVVYSGDTMPCKNMEKISKNADLLIHDSTFLELDESRGKAHANVKDAVKIAKKANVKQLILTNISRRYTNAKEIEKEAKEIFPNSKVAYDLMKIKLK